jgi:hypothetical protein
MIAVVLVALHHDFNVDLVTSTWLVSAFYQTGAVGQPLMGQCPNIRRHRQGNELPTVGERAFRCWGRRRP